MARKKDSTYSRNEENIGTCDLSFAISQIGGRWKAQILGSLDKRAFRFSDFKKEYAYMTERMLTLQLQALERDGLIKRTVYAEVPARVEYTLTEMGQQLQPIFQQLSAWGARQRVLLETAIQCPQ